ncbi:MAG: alpha/beta fold hydrolase [Actinomycetaceae bacterium]|nr:alpha/beta fold hydrolase [Actinomycetaceae bacterium]
MGSYSVSNSVVSIGRRMRVRVHRFRRDFDVEGEPTFVLVHGIGVSSGYFLKLAELLVPYGDVISLDLPGFGKATRPDHPLSIAGFAAAVHQVLRFEGVKNPVVLGHSMGAQVVTELAARDPEWIDRILLIGPPVNALERTAWQVGLRFLQSSVHEPLDVTAFALSAYARSGIVWFMQTLPAMLTYPIGMRLADARARTVLMRGEHDYVASRAWLHDLQLAAQSGTDVIAPIIEVEGGAHSVIVRHADDVARAMIELGRQGAPGRREVENFGDGGVIIADEDGSVRFEADDSAVWEELDSHRKSLPAAGTAVPLAVADYARAGAQRVRTLAAEVGVAAGASLQDLRAPGRPVAVGIPGIVETWRHLEFAGAALRRAGWDVHLVPALDSAPGPVQLLSNRLDEYLRENDLTDVVIFAHSKGGLVGKMTMSGAESWRVRGMVSLGTPYAGSEVANLAPHSLGFDNLMPSHPEIRRQFTDLRANSKITSIEAKWDQQVPSGSWLPGARVVTADMFGHNHLLTSPEALRLLVEEMERFKP